MVGEAVKKCRPLTLSQNLRRLIDSILQAKGGLTEFDDRFTVSRAGCLFAAFLLLYGPSYQTPPVTVDLAGVLLCFQLHTTKLIGMENNEGRELVEYAAIAVLVSAGVTLMFSGAGEQITRLWNVVARFVLG